MIKAGRMPSGERDRGADRGGRVVRQSVRGEAKQPAGDRVALWEGQSVWA